MDLYNITARFDEHRASSSSKYPFALQYRGTILMEFIHYKHLNYLCATVQVQPMHLTCVVCCGTRCHAFWGPLKIIDHVWLMNPTVIRLQDDYRLDYEQILHNIW